MAEYVVSVDQSPEYDVGVNYEIPSKSIQNANLILDHLNSQFDGSKTLFALTHNNNVYAPINDQQIIIREIDSEQTLKKHISFKFNLIPEFVSGLNSLASVSL